MFPELVPSDPVGTLNKHRKCGGQKSGMNLVSTGIPMRLPQHFLNLRSKAGIRARKS